MRTWLKEWSAPLLAAAALGIVVWKEAVPRPASGIRARVSQLTSTLAGRAALARRLAQFYSAWADVVDQSPEALASTQHFRDAHALSGKLFFLAPRAEGTAPYPSEERVPGLAEAVDRRLADEVGLEVRPLSADVRAKLAAALRSIAHDCEEVQ